METRGFFERALVLDAKNVEALVGMAIVDTFIGYADMSGDRNVHLSAAEAALAKALAMSPNHALAHATLGAVQIVTDRHSKVLQSANERWSWITISPLRTRLLVTRNIS